MSDRYGLTRENILSVFPLALRQDSSMRALAEAAAELLAQRPGEIERLAIYPKIEELPEALLDILAYDFKVDWYDYNYTLDEKRKTLKGSWLVHKRLGTKYAVESAVSAIYPNANVQEWFEYGGEPFHFRLNLNASEKSMSVEQHNRVLKLVQYYKNLRSHLDAVQYTIEAKSPAMLRLGGHMASVVQIPVPEIPDKFLFRNELLFRSNAPIFSTLPVPEIE